MHKLSARLHVSLFELGKRLSAEDRGSEGILGSSVPIVGVGVLAGVFIPTTFVTSAVAISTLHQPSALKTCTCAGS